MKKTLLILAMIILAASGMNAQALQDSGGARKEISEKRSQQQIIDKNADGIDDALQQKGKKFKNKKDKFIDRDGDGICDGRASGLGWRLGSKSSIRQGGGKKGPGGRQ